MREVLSNFASPVFLSILLFKPSTVAQMVNRKPAAKNRSLPDSPSNIRLDFLSPGVNTRPVTTMRICTEVTQLLQDFSPFTFAGKKK